MNDEVDIVDKDEGGRGGRPPPIPPMLLGFGPKLSGGGDRALAIDLEEKKESKHRNLAILS